MYPLYRWLYHAFGFSRSQSNGFLILLPLVGLIVCSEPLYRIYSVSQEPDFQEERRFLDSLITQWPSDQPLVSEEATNLPKAPSRLFAFDPNVVSSQDLQALGFEQKTITRMERYRRKGGKFRLKRDLLKMGVDSIFFKMLENAILLPDEYEKQPAKTFETKTFERNKKDQSKALFDLNSADSSNLIEINGIGVKISLRIIKYREALGGFHSVRQVYEVYNLDSAVADRLTQRAFVAPDFRTRKMYINHFSALQLAAHPYLTRQVAERIVAYRFKHGKFNSIEDLEKIVGIDGALIEKIKPYLSFDDQDASP